MGYPSENLELQKNSISNVVVAFRIGESSYIAKWFWSLGSITDWLDKNLGVAVEGKSDSPLKRFQNEVKIYSDIANANVKLPKRLAVNEKTKLIIYEMVKGASIDLLLLQTENRKIFDKLLDTVGRLGREHIYYLDLHPGNFLWTNDGEIIPIDYENCQKGEKFAAASYAFLYGWLVNSFGPYSALSGIFFTQVFPTPEFFKRVELIRKFQLITRASNYVRTYKEPRRSATFQPGNIQDSEFWVSSSFDCSRTNS
jgi:hypothetical protein